MSLSFKMRHLVSNRLFLAIFVTHAVTANLQCNVSVSGATMGNNITYHRDTICNLVVPTAYYYY